MAIPEFRDGATSHDACRCVMRTALMSIKPRYAEAILDGRKSVELRRGRTRLTTGDRVIIYASAPTMAVIGEFTVAGVIFGEPGWLYSVGMAAHGYVSRGDFEAYYEGADVGSAIDLFNRATYDAPVPLATLRERIPGFRPPQSYMWWRDDVELLTGAP